MEGEKDFAFSTTQTALSHKDLKSSQSDPLSLHTAISLQTSLIGTTSRGCIGREVTEPWPKKKKMVTKNTSEEDDEEENHK